MLGFGLRRQPGGVGRHEGEGLLRIAPVFRQIEMHPPDQVPGGVQVLEKGLKIGTGPGQRSRERSAHLIPQRQQGIGIQILRPRIIIGAVKTRVAKSASLGAAPGQGEGRGSASEAAPEACRHSVPT